jgi:hypothetical protein
MKKRNLILIPAISVFSSFFSAAASYNVKYLASGLSIPTSSLQGAYGATGESWNQATGSFNDLVDSSGNASTIDISGLSGTLSFATDWGLPTNTERSAGAFTITNVSLNGTNQPLDNGNIGTNATTFTPGSNYVLFKSIVANGSGNISIIADALDGANPTRLHVNGLQIVSVPETSSAAILGLSAFASV